MNFNQTETPTIFVGYDEKQDLASRVCKESIKRTASGPVAIYDLDHRKLREIGLLWRKWTTETTGIVIDQEDGKPFSTQFAHSRFLTPAFAHWLGVREKRVLFVDSDFVFVRDIYDLFLEADEIAYNDSEICLSVVKHNYIPENKTKMDNQVQSAYPRKLWSSMIMFELDKWHPNASDVNEFDGGYLHRFEAYEDQNIGELSLNWNLIPGYYDDVCEEPYAVHFTEGCPDLDNYKVSRYAEIYHSVARTLNYEY